MPAATIDPAPIKIDPAPIKKSEENSGNILQRSLYHAGHWAGLRHPLPTNTIWFPASLCAYRIRRHVLERVCRCSGCGAIRLLSGNSAACSAALSPTCARCNVALRPSKPRRRNHFTFRTVGQVARSGCRRRGSLILSLVHLLSFESRLSQRNGCAKRTAPKQA